MHGRAGAKERGELENRVTKLIGEIKEAGNVLFKAGNYRRALRRYEVGVRSCL